MEGIGTRRYSKLPVVYLTQARSLTYLCISRNRHCLPILTCIHTPKRAYKQANQASQKIPNYSAEQKSKQTSGNGSHIPNLKSILQPHSLSVFRFLGRQAFHPGSLRHPIISYLLLPALRTREFTHVCHSPVFCVMLFKKRNHPPGGPAITKEMSICI